MLRYRFKTEGKLPACSELLLHLPVKNHKCWARLSKLPLRLPQGMGLHLSNNITTITFTSFDSHDSVRTDRSKRPYILVDNVSKAEELEIYISKQMSCVVVNV
jgi:hypothetical protein